MSWSRRFDDPIPVPRGRHSSSHSKTHRAAMGFSVSFTGCVKRSKECWNETHTISASAPAAKTKKKPASVS